MTDREAVLARYPDARTTYNPLMATFKHGVEAHDPGSDYWVNIGFGVTEAEAWTRAMGFIRDMDAALERAIRKANL